MSELETLLLDCNRLTEVPRVDCCPALRRLDISCNVLSEIPLPNLISRSLEILDIACNQDLFIDSTEFQQLWYVSTLLQVVPSFFRLSLANEVPRCGKISLMSNIYRYMLKTF